MLVLLHNPMLTSLGDNNVVLRSFPSRDIDALHVPSLSINRCCV